jgi:hypothetical protein
MLGQEFVEQVKDTNSFHFISRSLFIQALLRFHASSAVFQTPSSNLPVAHISTYLSTVHSLALTSTPVIRIFMSSPMLYNLFSLPLVRLGVLEREPTRPLVCTRLPAYPSIAARKQNTPHRHRGQEGAAQGAQAEAEHARLGPHGVAVEGVGGVQHCGDGERGERVGGFGVCVGGCGAYADELVRTLFLVKCGWVWFDLPSVSLLLSGTEPVSRTVNAPTERSVKPRVREK